MLELESLEQLEDIIRFGNEQGTLSSALHLAVQPGRLNSRNLSPVTRHPSPEPNPNPNPSL